MATYLIDFENVHSDGLKGIDQLTSEDRVYLFYSQNADSITFETHFSLVRSVAKIEMFEAKRLGKNAIDFHIATFLGYLIAQDLNESYFVISKDNGYQFSFDFWRTFFSDCKIKLYYAYSIGRAINLLKQNKVVPTQDEPATVKDEEIDGTVLTVDDILTEMGAVTPEVTEPKADSRVDALRARISEECTDQELTSLADLIDTAEGKQELYRGIIKLFGQSRGLVIYHGVKKK